MYDLVIRGGRVIDPTTGVDAVLDVAVLDGRVVAVATTLPAHAARSTIDAAGLLVVPGLVDLHAHVYWGVTSLGMWPDDVCPPGGVTTVVDAGSAGSETFPAFRRWIIDGSLTRVLAFVNVSRLGLVGIRATGELQSDAYLDLDGLARVIDDNRDCVRGIKIRLSRDVIRGSALPILRATRAVASTTRSRLHVHIGDTRDPLPDILDQLGPGDTVTHMQTPKAHGLLDEQGRLLAAARAARARGILFDSGHGKTHFSFAVASRLIEEGFPPDTISTDMSLTTATELAPGLLTVMNKWLAVGLTIPQVIRAVTTAPASALGMEGEIGGLAIGQSADLAILQCEAGAFSYADVNGQARSTEVRLAPLATIRAGEVAWAEGG